MTNDMIGKLQEMQQKIEESKSKLDSAMVEGEAGSGTVKVIMNGNRVVKNVSINQMILEGNSAADELEDLLVIALNRALEKADKIHEQEMQKSASAFLPGLA